MRILLLLFVATSGFSQVKFSETYYPHINEAEIAITKHDFKTSLFHYEKAFNNIRNPLSRDVFNAVVCKIKLNDFEGAKPYLLRLARCGVSTHILEQSTLFSNHQNQWVTFKPIYDQILEGFESTISEEGLQLINDWKEDNKKRFNERRSIIIEGGNTVIINSGEPIVVRSNENYRNEFIAKLHPFLSFTKGYAEYEAGVTDVDLLLNPLNELLFSNVFRITNLFTDPAIDTLSRSKLDVEKYLEEGVESGKWHRDLMMKHNFHKKIQISTVQVEEECELVEGKYFIKKPVTPPLKFEAPVDLEVAKIIFNLKGESPFKMNSSMPPRMEVFATCKDAKSNLKDWEPLGF